MFLTLSKFYLRAVMAAGATVVFGFSMVLAEPAASPVAENLLSQWAEKAAAAEKAEAITVAGADDWLFFGPELRHLAAGRFWGDAAAKVSRATRPETADPLPAILDFKAQLDKQNIELLLVPVPPKAVVYPDKMSNSGVPDVRLDSAHQEFYNLLREKGVKVVDLVPGFQMLRINVWRANGESPLNERSTFYAKQDTHWSGQGAQVAATLIAAQIKDREWLRDHKKNEYAQETRELKINGDLWEDLPEDKRPPQETLPLRFVGVKEGNALTPIEPDEDSPVLLLGDSHNLVFHDGDDMHAQGAGLPDQLALELGFPVNLIAVRGSGATPARVNLLRKMRANPEYLANTKLVVWCFSAREFTESSGWSLVPVLQ